MNRFGSNQFRDWLFYGVPVGRLFGISIALHPILIIFMVFDLLRVLANARGQIGSPDFLVGSYLVVSWTAIVLGSVLLHEFGHCYGARLVGGHADHILLWPLGGLAFTEGSQRSPWHEFIVVLLGPVVSLLLFLFGRLAMAMIPTPPPSNLWATLGWITLTNFTDFNLTIFIFNVLTPLFPMDSARLLRSGLSMRYEPGKITYNVCLLGFVVAGLLIAVGLFNFGGAWLSRHSYWAFLIAGLGIISCLNEMRRIQYEPVYSNPYAGDDALRLARSGLFGWLGFSRSGGPGAAAEGGVKTRRRARGPARIVELFADREQIERDLQDAIDREDFHLAAQLRDRLNRIKAAGGKS